MKKLIVGLLFSSVLYCDDVHQFAGKHFVASYLDCDTKALADVTKMIEAMDVAVGASGATVLNKTFHVFQPNGLTLVYLLSESHASIHTYPECNACFVDLFTCGNSCTSVGFDQALRSYLQPKTVNARLFLRHEGIEDVTLGDNHNEEKCRNVEKIEKR